MSEFSLPSLWIGQNIGDERADFGAATRWA